LFCPDIPDKDAWLSCDVVKVNTLISVINSVILRGQESFQRRSI